MAEDGGAKSVKETLEEQYFNKAAVQDIADAFDIPFNEALYLWVKFVGTVEKLKIVADKMSASSSTD
jgi:hypothetical protein